MENNAQRNTLKTVLLVFAILFSIVLVPGLIVGIPAGGVVLSLSEAVSQEGVEEMVKEAKLSETLHEILLDEILQENSVEDLNPEFWTKLIEENITAEVVDGIVGELVDCIYNGSEPELEYDKILGGFRDGLNELMTNGYDDLYAAVSEGTKSKYFSEELVASFKAELESSLDELYSEYGVQTTEELEKVYDTYFGAGAFDAYIEEEQKAVEEEWKSRFDTDVKGEIDSLLEEAERETNEALYEMVRDPEVRSLFDSMKTLSEKSNTIKTIAYGVMIASVLILMICYWFETAGFVVPAIPLIIGGLLCKALLLFKTLFLVYLEELVRADSELAEVGDIMMDVFYGVLTPIFAGASTFGTIAIGIGVLLILLAILRGVIRKNSAVTE